MTDFLPLSLDSVVGRGTRISADFVLTQPPAALLACEDFDRTRSLAGVLPTSTKSWTVVLNARPGLTVESVQCLSPQVVRVHLIATSTVTVGTAVPSYAVIPGFKSIVGPDSIIDRTYQRTVIRRTGDATLDDIHLAETRARDVVAQENPLREAAADVVSAARSVGIGAGIVLPVAVAVGVFLAFR